MTGLFTLVTVIGVAIALAVAVVIDRAGNNLVQLLPSLSVDHVQMITVVLTHACLMHALQYVGFLLSTDAHWLQSYHRVLIAYGKHRCAAV